MLGDADTRKEFGVFDLPFLFDNYREVDTVFDGPIGSKLLEKLPEKGLVGLCYFETGFRYLTNNRKPVAKLEDFRGLKIRTIHSAVYVDVFNTLGAVATPLPFTEVYSALESKAIDGQETPYTNIHGNKFFEVQKYASATGYIYGGAIVMVGKKFWDKLSGDEQKVLQESCPAARDFERKTNRELDPKLRAELKDKGMTINDIAPDERAKMRAALEPVYEKHSANLGADLVKQVQAELAKVRVAAK